MKPPLDIIKVMTPFPYTISSRSPVPEALNMLDEHDINELPVTAEDKLVGIITRRDVEVVLSLAHKKSSLEGLIVRDICRTDPYIVETNCKVSNVIANLINSNRQAALVVKKGRLVGVFTQANAYSLLLKYLLGKEIHDEPPDILA